MGILPGGDQRHPAGRQDGPDRDTGALHLAGDGLRGLHLGREFSREPDPARLRVSLNVNVAGLPVPR